jgi:hypothetical protein
MPKVAWCKKLRSIERRIVLVRGDGSADFRRYGCLGAEGFHDEVKCLGAGGFHDEVNYLPSTGLVGIYRPILLRKKTQIGTPFDVEALGWAERLSLCSEITFLVVYRNVKFIQISA